MLLHSSACLQDFLRLAFYELRIDVELLSFLPLLQQEHILDTYPFLMSFFRKAQTPRLSLVEKYLPTSL
jgi:hypothetical protein